MKKIFALLATLSLMVTSCGTVNKAPTKEKGWLQTTFFKNTFGDSYGTVKFRMDYAYQNYSDDKRMLKYFSVKFGGVKWDSVRMYFDNDKAFCKITFEKSFATKIGATEWYEDVKDELERKYGQAKEVEDGIAIWSTLICWLL